MAKKTKKKNPGQAKGPLTGVSDLQERYTEITPLLDKERRKTFSAVDTRSGEKVFIKMPGDKSGQDPDAVRSFLNEISILRMLTGKLSESGYPVVPLLESSEQEEIPYLIQPLLKGWNLAKAMQRRHPYNGSTTIEVVENCLEILVIIHNAGVIHGDISPENIFIVTGAPVHTDGTLPADFAVKLVDFESARIVDGTDNVPGKPILCKAQYMAPELAVGRPLSPQSDLYALGVVFYEMLAGGYPYKVETLEEIRNLRQDSIKSMPSVLGVPAIIEAFVKRLLSVDPGRRFSNASECLRELRSFRDIDHWLNKSTSPVFYKALPDSKLRSGSSYVAVRKFVDSRDEESTVEYLRERIETGRITRGHTGKEEITTDASPEPVREEESTGAMMPGPWPYPPPNDETEEEGAEREKDIVDCTVFSAPEVSAGDNILVHVFAHLPERSEEAAEMAREFDEDARRRGVKTLDSEIRRGSILSFRLEMHETLIDEPVKHLTWRGRTESVQFFVKISGACRAKTLIGKVAVVQDSVPIGHVYFKLKVREAGADAAVPASSHSQPTGTMKRYNYAFISYASTDRAEVLRRVQMLNVIKIKYFQDVLSLDPGVRWKKELYRHIDKADVFFLFWSAAARDSKWVLKEVKYAIALKQDEDENPPEIIPVIIEGPPIPEPPEELEHIHFNDRFLYFISAEDHLR